MSEYIVSRDKLSHNIEELKKLANGVPIWAVIKGNGYGLGVLPLSELLYAHGIRHFCVTEASEARILRENGFSDVQILMLRSICDAETLSELMDLNVILTVGSALSAQAVEKAAAGRADIAQVHLKIDTGMGRYGFDPNDLSQIISVYKDHSHIAVSGIYTHFNCAFCDDQLTDQEFSAFSAVLSALHSQGIETGTAHCCNSSAFFKFPHMHLDGVRLGSALLGRVSFQTKLRPVGFVQTQVDELHHVRKGQSTGYGAIWKAKKDRELAIVPIGWYHGFYVSCKEDRSRKRDCLRGIFSNIKAMLKPPCATVEIGGKTCRVVGAIGMLHCAVDVTGMNVKAGDRVTVQISPLHINGIKIKYK
ncbi:MAG: alanine racemase [Ruminococcaceae bacterium]|nr:alanine racemase [Oscillospiraceae bacterium]